MSAIAIDLSSSSGDRVSRRRVMRFGVVAGAVAGVAATAVTAWVARTGPFSVDPTDATVWRSLVVASYVAAGTYTSWRRPGNRLGPIITGAGFVYAATSLTALRAPVAYALGETALVVAVVYTAWMYLAYPGGRLESRFERVFVIAAAFSVALLWVLVLLISPVLSLQDSLLGCAAHCPPNGVHIAAAPAGALHAISTGLNIVLTVVLIGTSMLVFHKARSGPNPRRSAMTPLAMVFIASLIGWVATLFVVDSGSGLNGPMRIADGVLLVAVPVAILVSRLQADLFAAKSLGRVAAHASASPLTAPAVQRIIGDALGDSTVSLVLWDPAHRGYTDVYGAPIDIPHDGRACCLTSVAHEEPPLAALIHDPMLDTDSDILRGLAATALMLLQKTRLVDELRASRTRIVATAERERQRLERDLHDGAQNRLMAIQVKLRLAQRAQAEDLAELLETISNDAAEAVEELRALARGIYPSVLRDRGVADALRSLAIRAPIPVSVADEGIARCSPGIEAAIYFCSLEAIQNAIKHAGGDARVTVTLGRDERGIRFAVADDGIGMNMTSAGEGVGFASMRDRIGAVGGDLEITSTPGRGTRVAGTIPADSYARTPGQFERAA